MLALFGFRRKKFGGFPTVVASASDAGSEAFGTTHNFTMPAGIQLNDIILIYLVGYNKAFNTASSTPPSGFTELCDDGTMAVLWKRAAGTESSTTINFVTNSSIGPLCKRAVILRGVDTASSPELSKTGNGTSPTSQTPASKTSSWGANNNLFLVMMAFFNNANESVFPVGYALEGARISNTTTFWGIIHRTKQSLLATDSPSIWTMNTTGASGTTTIVLKGT